MTSTAKSGRNPPARAEMLCFGRITGAHGLKGDVRVTSYTAAPEDIAAYGPLRDETGRRSFVFTSLRVVKGHNLIARIEGVTDRAAAESLRGVRLYVERERLPEPEEDEWYYSDLIGLKVLDPEGERLGDVLSVQNFGAGDLLEIRLADTQKTVFIPFTAACVPRIDVKLGSLSINPPWGLSNEEQSERPGG
jgi:16S rRNA processing protein RimM